MIKGQHKIQKINGKKEEKIEKSQLIENAEETENRWKQKKR